MLTRLVCPALAVLALTARLANAQGGASDQSPPSASPIAPATGTRSLSESLAGDAKAEYESGKLLYEDGDYAGAALKFQRAYELSADPRLLWNRAAAEKNLRHYAQVRTLMRKYLDTGGSLVSAEERADAEELIGMVSGFVSEVTISVDQVDAEIAIDGRSIGKSPLPTPVALDMGEHEITVSKVGFKPLSKRGTVAGGRASTLDFRLQSEKHEGLLRVIAPSGSAVRIDGKRLGFGDWQGTLPSGSHNVRVDAPGKQRYSAEAVVQDGQVTVLQVSLQDTPLLPPAPVSEPDRGGVSAWVWVGLGAILVGGAVTGFMLLKPEAQGPPAPVDGTLGRVPLGLHF